MCLARASTGKPDIEGTLKMGVCVRRADLHPADYLLPVWEAADEVEIPEDRKTAARAGNLSGLSGCSWCTDAL